MFQFEDYGFKLWYSVVQNTSSRRGLGPKSIVVTMQSQYPGWFGVGFNPTGNTMAISDTYAGWIPSLGAPQLIDGKSWDNINRPVTDSQQDATILATERVGDSQTIQFSRLLETHDPNDFQFVDNSSFTIVWAFAEASQDYLSASQSGTYHCCSSSSALPFEISSFSTAVDEIFVSTVAPVKNYTVSHVLAASSMTSKHISTMIAGYSFDLWWSISGDVIDFVLTSSTRGWVAIQIGHNMLMYPADTMWGSVNPFGAVSMSDSWQSSYHVHQDDSQLGGENGSVFDISGYYNSSSSCRSTEQTVPQCSELRFSRKLAAKLEMDPLIIASRTLCTV